MKNEKMAKTYIEKLGFKDDDLYEKNHDELMNFLVINKSIFSLYLIKKYYFESGHFIEPIGIVDYLDNYRTGKGLVMDVNFQYTLPNINDINTKLDLEYCVSNTNYSRNVFVNGFLDAKLNIKCHIYKIYDEIQIDNIYNNLKNEISKYHMCLLFPDILKNKMDPKWESEYEEKFRASRIWIFNSQIDVDTDYIIEIKTKIESFGAVLRELKYYEKTSGIKKIVLFSNDDKYRQLFEENGIIFITEKDINNLKNELQL